MKHDCARFCVGSVKVLKYPHLCVDTAIKPRLSLRLTELLKNQQELGGTLETLKKDAQTQMQHLNQKRESPLGSSFAARSSWGRNAPLLNFTKASRFSGARAWRPYSMVRAPLDDGPRGEGERRTSGDAS